MCVVCCVLCVLCVVCAVCCVCYVCVCVVFLYKDTLCSTEISRKMSGPDEKITQYSIICIIMYIYPLHTHAFAFSASRFTGAVVLLGSVSL